MQKTETFAYWAAEAALARLFSATQAPQRVTFRARMGDALKLGVLGTAGPGKGRRHPYTREDVYRLLTYFDLLEIGISRAAAADLVARHWSGRGARQKTLSAAFGLAEKTSDDGDVFLVVTARVMSSNWLIEPQFAKTDIYSASKLGEVVGKQKQPMVVINVSERIRSLDEALKELAMATYPPAVEISKAKRHG